MKDFSVRVPGTEFILRSNRSYRIEGKEDPESPIEFRDREEPFTKIPSPYNTEDAKIVFNPERSIWDTGFYEDSPCYSKEQREYVEETVKTLQENLVVELEKQFPEGALDYRNPGDKKHYLDSWRFVINQKTTIITDTPQNFFGLWAAILDKAVVPKGEENKPIYRALKTPFVIIDRDEKSNKEKTKVFEKANAQRNLLNLVLSEKPKDVEFAVDILEYVGLKGVNKKEPSILTSQFNNWIENKKDSLRNAELFNEELERLSSDEGREELSIFKKIKEGVRTNKISVVRDEMFLRDESIGSNPKTAAKLINKSDNLKTLLFEVINES